MNKTHHSLPSRGRNAQRRHPSRLPPYQGGRHRSGLISVQTAAIFLRIALIALALIIPTTLVGIFIATEIDTASLEADILTHNILYSSHGIGFIDTQTQQAPLGIIDINKLDLAVTSKRLDIAFQQNPLRQAAKITIGDRIAYYHQELYEDYAPLARTRLPGIGGARRFIRTVPVIVQQNGHKTAATATIEVISPR